MTNILLSIILIMVLVTMVCAVMTTIIMSKETKSQAIVKKVLQITGVVVLIGVVIWAAVGVSYLKKDTPSNNETVTLATAGFNEVSLNDYLSLIKSEEKSVILVARPTCGFCEKFTPILKQAADDLNIKVNYVDTDKFTEEEWTTFNNSFSFLNTTEWGTPLVLISENGNLIAENQGYVELNAIKDFFTSNGIGD